MPPAAGPSPDRIELRPIGHVRTAHRRLEDTPIQTHRNPDEPGRLVVLHQYAAALDGLEGFDYAHLICFLDRAWEADGGGTRPFTGDRLRPVPFLLQDSGQRVGVFATRVPVRPNYLALSLVRVVAVRGDEVDFAGVDLLDGTPVLDVKPFEPHLDVPGYTPGSGWLDHLRGGWYSQHDTAANPMVHPGREGLRGVGLDPPDG
jgi:tRNA-Thr(GGU) m(6)t(6)A37 methyltransferase TsaA